MPTVNLIRERFCVIIPACYALRKRAEAGKRIATALKSKQVPRRFFEEIFLHLSLLLGFPAMLDGFEQLHRIVPRQHRPRRTSRTRTGRGRGILKAVYGKQTEKLLGNLHALHPELPDMILNDVYGRVFPRPGLTLAEREIINVTVLSIQGLDRQLVSHIRGAARAGVTEQSFGRMFSMLQQVTSKRFSHARELVEDVVSQKKK